MLSQTVVISTVNSIANSLIVLLFINFPFCDIFCLHKMRYNRHIADCDIFALQMRYDINPYLSCRKAHIAPKVYRIVRYIANPPGFISLPSYTWQSNSLVSVNMRKAHYNIKPCCSIYGTNCSVVLFYNCLGNC